MGGSITPKLQSFLATERAHVTTSPSCPFSCLTRRGHSAPCCGLLVSSYSYNSPLTAFLVRFNHTSTSPAPNSCVLHSSLMAPLTSQRFRNGHRTLNTASAVFVFLPSLLKILLHSLSFSQPYPHMHSGGRENLLLPRSLFILSPPLLSLPLVSSTPTIQHVLLRPFPSHLHRPTSSRNSRRPRSRGQIQRSLRTPGTGPESFR